MFGFGQAGGRDRMQRDGLALQLAIPSRVDLLLPSSEHVLDAMRTVGTNAQRSLPTVAAQPRVTVSRNSDLSITVISYTRGREWPSPRPRAVL